MEELPENSKESPHSVRANGLIDVMKAGITINYDCFNMNGKFLSHGARPVTFVIKSKR